MSIHEREVKIMQDLQSIDYCMQLLETAQAVMDFSKNHDLAGQLITAAAVCDESTDTADTTDGWLQITLPPDAVEIKHTTNGAVLTFPRFAIASVFSGTKLQYNSLWISQKLFRKTDDDHIMIAAPMRFSWYLSNAEHESLRISSEQLVRISVMMNGSIEILPLKRS
ncbi:MAG: hypothetical protein PUF17_08175 [Lactimicrobium massiliense]|nr:hypothetical protein [Lactimicrobium massiliense]MDD6560932.1 hypothetical protein [Lactimicrobium massiliense]